ncbi:glutaredoxin-3-like [Argiope bruennichi]|uniref:glutaredoxin-3-like n=1 Tax=Argiope bruennichi TaxID=94029 RepID=UPI00249406B0|nr:glutaredoxin-3-like [Argiope bruennichi]
MMEVTGTNELSEKLNSLSDYFTVLFFYVEDSAECNQMNDIITELQNDEKNKNAAVIKINASKNEEICKKYNVTDVPAFVFIGSKLMGGDVLDNLVGANVPLFSKKFEEHVEELQKFKDRLKYLINKAPVMLFMKGNRNAPRCGFSKQAIALLEDHKVDYETFDILDDFEVREGLKKFSNWPTYPQLYVKGELIGGLDILKELAENGELGEVLSSN